MNSIRVSYPTYGFALTSKMVATGALLTGEGLVMGRSHSRQVLLSVYPARLGGDRIVMPHNGIVSGRNSIVSSRNGIVMSHNGIVSGAMALFQVPVALSCLTMAFSEVQWHCLESQSHCREDPKRSPPSSLRAWHSAELCTGMREFSYCKIKLSLIFIP